MLEINVKPEVWAKAQLIFEEMQKLRALSRERLGLSHELFDGDDPRIDAIARETKQRAERDFELMCFVKDSMVKLRALDYTFWSILNEDPQIDIDNFVYMFDSQEQKLYLDHAKPCACPPGNAVIH